MPFVPVTPTGLATGGKFGYDPQPTNSARNLTGSNIKLHQIYFDNTLNASRSFLKFYALDAASVVVGTTVPLEVYFANPNDYLLLEIEGSAAQTVLSYVVVTIGGTYGSTAPTYATPLYTTVST